MPKERGTGAGAKAAAKRRTASNPYGTRGRGNATAPQYDIPAFGPDHEDRPTQIAPEAQQPARQFAPNDPETDNRFNNVTADLTNLRDAIDEDRTRMESMNDSLKKIQEMLEQQAALRLQPAGITGLPISTNPVTLLSRQNTGNDPLQLVCETYPWIDQNLLINIISKKLEVKDLVKLIPEEDRPKGRSAITGLASGIHIDGATGQTTLITESGTYEKDFPDFPTLNYALTVYASIRSLYDKEQAGFGFAINAYIKTLTKWYKNDNLHFRSILAYCMAHFRKHQTAVDPKAWIDVDLQLFVIHIRSNPISIQSTPHPINSPSPNKNNSLQSTPLAMEVCKNFNNPSKGCKWEKCIRNHHCSICGTPKKPAFECSHSNGVRLTVKP